MKELSIEEKAKRYDEAIEIAKGYYTSDCHTNLRIAMENLFSELKESEDEMIKKELISFLQLPHPQFVGERKQEKWIAWLEKQCEEIDLANREYWRGYREGKQEILDKYANLEKQGEQPQGKSALEAVKEEKVDNQNCVKPVNNVEPKFKVGDWIIHDKNIKLANSLMLVTSKDNNEYLCKDIDGQCSYDIEFIDKEYHLWTIQDAKDGDVLVVGNMIFIHKRTLANHIVSYCKLIGEKFDSFEDARTCCEGNIYIYPATKEQRDLLFQKMKEADYEWDAEKKELKKIEQKPAWSEEDENKVTLFMQLTEGCDNEKELADWLESLKDGVQPKQRWDEEDNKIIEEIINDIECARAINYHAPKEGYEFRENWLKSLRFQNSGVTDKELAQAKKEAYNGALDKIEYHSGEPTFDDGWEAAIWYLKKRNIIFQNTWKPSLSQLNALGVVAKGNAPDDIEEINSLYNNLKKLKDKAYVLSIL